MMDNKTFVVIGIVIALVIGVLAVFLASGDPDGLESTALVVQGQKTLTGGTPENAEINEQTTGRFSYTSPMPDYSLGEQMGHVSGISGGAILGDGNVSLIVDVPGLITLGTKS